MRVYIRIYLCYVSTLSWAYFNLKQGFNVTVNYSKFSSLSNILNKYSLFCFHRFNYGVVSKLCSIYPFVWLDNISLMNCERWAYLSENINRSLVQEDSLESAPSKHFTLLGFNWQTWSKIIRKLFSFHFHTQHTYFLWYIFKHTTTETSTIQQCHGVVCDDELFV